MCRIACFARNKFVTSFAIDRPLGGLWVHAFVFHIYVEYLRHIYVELRLNLHQALSVVLNKISIKPILHSN